MEQDDRLWQALDVFLQYGFRKTSMDDVAQVLGISRQALYKQYGNKRDLFEAVITHTQALCLVEAEKCLRCETSHLSDRLTNSIDLIAGQFIEKLRASPHATEVIQIGEEGEVGRKCQLAFQDVLFNVLKEDASIRNTHKLKDQIEVLSFVIKGLIHGSQTPEEFKIGSRKAVNVIFR